tara:strand:+ start:5579 stop:6397 length:819 start_codon:yes stop_codon:yes gene_type:complete
MKNVSSIEPLHYKHTGLAEPRTNDSPVVLIHGLLGMGRNLGALARSLADDYSILSVDLLNHGRSPRTDVMDFTLLANSVVNLLTDLGIAKAHFIGHSLGGKVAMTIALNYPDQTDKCIIADIAPVTYAPEHNDLFALLSAIDLSQYRQRAELQAHLTKQLKDASVIQLLLQNLKRSRTGWQWQMHLPAIIASYDALREGIHLPENGQQANCPCLFLCGGQSHYWRDEYEVQARKLFSFAQFHTIASASHWLHIERPEQFNTKVADFLAFADD